MQVASRNGIDTSSSLTSTGRSTMAEGIFRSLTESNPRFGKIDSAGTSSYNKGFGPDSRTMAILEKNNILDYEHVARGVHTSDFTEFDYILAMDRDNLHDLQTRQQRLARSAGTDAIRAKVMLFGDFGGEVGEEVGDPYYGAIDGFEIAFQQLSNFSKGFISKVSEDQIPSG